MLPPYRINPNNTNKRIKKTANTTFDKGLHPDFDVRIPQMTSNDLKTTQTKTKSNEKNKIILKVGSMQENIEKNDQYFDEILDNNDIKKDLAMQIISNDKTLRSGQLKV